MATNRDEERSGFPSPFDVGTSGQRSMFARRVIDPAAAFFTDSAAAARGQVDFEKARAARTPQSQAVSPLVASAAIPPSVPGGVAQKMPSAPNLDVAGLAPRRGLSREAFGPAIQNQGQTGADRLAGMGYATRPVQGAPGVTRMDGRGRTIYTDDQANTADWIEGGMRPGVSSVGSGQDALATMQRANAIRGESLDAAGGPRVGIIGNSAVDETNARFAESRERDSMKNMGRTRTNALVQMREAGMRQQNAQDELGMRERRADMEDARMAQTADIAQQRVGLEREELGMRAQAAGLAAEATRADLAERDRINKLRDRYEAETDPGKREQIGRALLTLQGKEPSDQGGRWMLADMETGAQDQFGNPVTRKVPVNPVTGQVFQPGGGQGAAQVPAVAVQALRSNPQMAQQFDQKYGQGAAARYLGG